MRAYLAHLRRDRKGWYYSGYNASGDPLILRGQRGQAPAPVPYDAVVDVGREFLLTSDGLLYILGPEMAQAREWEPARLVVAARLGMFGFRLLEWREDA